MCKTKGRVLSDTLSTQILILVVSSPLVTVTEESQTFPKINLQIFTEIREWKNLDLDPWDLEVRQIFGTNVLQQVTLTMGKRQKKICVWILLIQFSLCLGVNFIDIWIFLSRIVEYIV